MAFVDCLLLDPLFQNGNISLGELLDFRSRRWHPFIGIMTFDSFDQFALLGFARNKRVGRKSIFANIQSQVRFAFGRVRAMAKEALIGQDRTNVSIELDRFFAEDRNGKQDQNGEGRQVSHDRLILIESTGGGSQFSSFNVSMEQLFSDC